MPYTWNDGILEYWIVCYRKGKEEFLILQSISKPLEKFVEG